MLKILLGIIWAGNFFPINDSIPDPKKVDVHSILDEKQEIVINSDFSVVHTRERKLVIFSKEGLSHAYTAMGYDKLNKINSFELTVIDPETGKTLDKAKFRDLSDAAVYSSSTIFDDNRYKYYQVQSGKFPIEVWIKTQTESKTNFFLPRWIPVQDFNQKVKSATLKVSYPTEMGLKYKAKNLLGEREESVESGITKITWSETDLPVQLPDLDEDEDHRLILAPVNFAVDGFEGKMNDWEGLAAWQYRLNEGRGELPQEFKDKIDQLVSHTEDPYEKIKILYGYLQTNFRYVSIQLGIGGWQTMTAADAVKYSYGDCKALTNLMKSMLQYVGLPSYYTLVYAGDQAEDIDVDIPSNQFNHVILQVPLPERESPVWLECTSPLLPAGYLGAFTKNRHVLVTKEGGGYLTKTPAYNNADWNRIHTTSTVKIDQQGNAEITSSRKLQGNFADDFTMRSYGMDSREQKELLNRSSPVSGLIIRDFTLDQHVVDSLPVTAINYEGFIQKFVQSTAKRVILKSFLRQFNQEILENNALELRDEYLIELPEIMNAETPMEDLNWEEGGVKIKLTNTLEGKILRVAREVSLELPESLEEDEKKELIKKINQFGSKSYYFIKPTLSTNL